MKTNKSIFEIIQGFGWDLSVRPVDFIANKGVIGRLIALILLLVWCFPVLGIFSCIAFPFWVFEKR
jgi:hypothetical protein